MRSVKEEVKLSNEFSRLTKKCSCGHSIILTKQNPVKICRHCKKLVYINERELFKYRLNPHKKSLRED